MFTACGVPIVTTACAICVLSATLVAVIVHVPTQFGVVNVTGFAVGYSESVPQFALHVTARFVVPLTVAVSTSAPPGCTVAVLGFTTIETPGGVVVTVTAATADCVLSAKLVAVTVQLVAGFRRGIRHRVGARA